VEGIKMKDMIWLKRGEYIDHYKQTSDGDVYVCLVLKDGIYHELLEREEK
jgi:hypothetical protein